MNEHLAPPTPATKQRLLAELVGALPLAAAMFDRQMRYLAHNDAWWAAHGREPGTQDVLGQCDYDVFPALPEEWREVHRRCLAGATERREIDVLDRSDGHQVYVRWVVTPWHDDAGAIGGILVCGENITRHVQTERRLEEREALIRQLFERSPVGLNLCTMDGLWLQSNRAFLDIIGYSEEEADGGLTYWQLTPRKYDADEAEQLEKLRTTKRYGPYEKEFIRKDGRLVPVRLNGFLVERDGVSYIWSLIEDLTSQRELEAQLEEERLKAIHASRLAMLGEMTAGIAHEINNPLSIIGGYAFALRDAIARGDTAAVSEGLEAIHEASGRAGKIVHGMRKFSRLGGGEPPSELTLQSIVDEALVLCRARIQTQGVSVTTEVSATRSTTGRAIELSQVLVNLLNNAFDAARSSEPKWIRLRAADEPEDGWVTLQVEDSGPRIPAEVAERIFRPFFTTKKAGEGTGLGLSISRTIVEAHGGTLRYDEDAPWTRFVVRLRSS